ncbi:MAG: threonylcarbamoyladenosine tRNA methylthiotransferase MtaB [Bacteroidales bacterium]|jgi:threonylcarbamoyladenosine tRNA methylthiotransferase MtaB|nr:threonylcarbamoyladenosine tRNA methylthiotransferase MtaB [Bacteroidales bacterium]NLH51721.1 tRNA (N(6)-L-threonylcarbamoyladenosine(37)-C(2))-methylthiotransferase MtaB [Bacteroidales bacterium]NPV36837.1 tRNA (N(6)-L-threonylcarbamoyladenosine(37)-C(2))-methylthiotransferase MtaB [Bacteroidales bacterium]
MSNKRIAFHTLGCKLNFSETSTLARRFRELGYEITEFSEEADVYVIHTCTVTQVAEKKSRAAIYQAIRRNPSARVAVIGCYSELRAESIRRIEGVDVVLGNQNKFDLPAIIEGKTIIDKETGNYQPCHEKEEGFAPEGQFYPAFSSGDRTRSFLKIQDGCDHFCTYCAIPYARGRSRSATVEQALDTARKAAATGVKEIVLTGVNIGDFGRRNGEKFIDFLRKANEERVVERMRISSIEPELLTDEIIELVASSEILMPHFHIPLQSGSDTILRWMRRKYDTRLFASRVFKIKELMPHACIAADVIVGFPGETEELFNETYHFLESLPVSYMHIFTYSDRPGTPASMKAGKLEPSVKRLRSKILHELSETKLAAFYQSCRGLEVSILFESDNENGMMGGFTENYIRVKTPYNPDLINTLIRTTLNITDEKGHYLYLPE